MIVSIKIFYGYYIKKRLNIKLTRLMRLKNIKMFVNSIGNSLNKNINFGFRTIGANRGLFDPEADRISAEKKTEKKLIKWH